MTDSKLTRSDAQESTRPNQGEETTTKEEKSLKSQNTTSQDHKPEPLPVDVENLPPRLTMTGRFCCWRYEWHDGRWTKMLKDPKTGYNGDSSNPNRFRDFGEAVNHLSEYDGLGVGMFGNLAGIDIDHCVLSDGTLSRIAADIVAIMNTYTEYSPSGTGLRILFTVSDDFEYDTVKYNIIKRGIMDGNQKINLEVHVASAESRFLTLTGQVIKAGDLVDRTDALRDVSDKYMKRPEPEHANTAPAEPVNLSDSELLDKMEASHDKTFHDLWNGDWEAAGYPSQSEADLALCGCLAWWTGRDFARIDSLYRQSGLMRKKWNEKRGSETYGQKTINLAIAGCRDVYDPETADAVDRFDEAHPDWRQDLHDFNERIASNDQDSKPVDKFKAYDVGEYVTGEGFQKDVDYFRKYKDRKTGFSNLDAHLTLYPGMGALGGAASLGKTTFCINLADNLAQAGQYVLYVALEQTALELSTKSIARHLSIVPDDIADAETKTYFTNVRIKNGETNDALERVKADYAEKTGGRFTILQGSFETTADDIQNYVEKFIQRTGIRPIVFIDYLQLVADPPTQFKQDQRAAIDSNIKTFKSMQLKNELLVILISSFNRGGYDTPVTYSDFKESSMIEYSCDYIWGLQLELLSDDSFYYKIGPKGGQVATTDQEKDQMIDEAIHPFGGGPKRVQFVSLKSRNGEQRYKCGFDYYMEHDLYDSGELADHCPFLAGADHSNLKEMKEEHEKL